MSSVFSLSAKGFKLWHVHQLMVRVLLVGWHGASCCTGWPSDSASSARFCDSTMTSTCFALFSWLFSFWSTCFSWCARIEFLLERLSQNWLSINDVVSFFWSITFLSCYDLRIKEGKTNIEWQCVRWEMILSGSNYAHTLTISNGVTNVVAYRLQTTRINHYLKCDRWKLSRLIGQLVLYA